MTREEAGKILISARILYQTLKRDDRSNQYSPFGHDEAVQLVAGAMPQLIQDMRMQELIEAGKQQFPQGDTGTVWAGMPAPPVVEVPGQALHPPVFGSGTGAYLGAAQHTYTSRCDGFHPPGKCKTERIAEQWQEPS